MRNRTKILLGLYFVFIVILLYFRIVVLNQLESNKHIPKVNKVKLGKVDKMDTSKPLKKVTKLDNGGKPNVEKDKQIHSEKVEKSQNKSETVDKNKKGR